MSASQPMTAPGIELSVRPGDRVARSLRRWIAEGRLSPGERLPSERALAERLQVARGTVRTVLDQLADEGLLTARKGHIRKVAMGPRTPGLMSNTVGVLTNRCDTVPSDRIESAGWELFIERGAMDAIRTAGLHAMSFYPERLFDGGVQELLRHRPRGIVVGRVGHRKEGRKLVQTLVDGGVQVSVYGDHAEYQRYDRVISDHEAGAYALTRWLIAQGRRRILRLWPRSAQGSYWLQGRDAGYDRAMREAGLEPLEPVVLQRSVSHTEGRREVFEHNARTYAGYLIGKVGVADGADALMCVSDGDVFPAAAACRLLGAEPNRDVTIVGYDNYWADRVDRQFEPIVPAATVDKRNPQLGEALVRLLLERSAGELPDEPQLRKVEPELIVPGEV